MSEINYSAYPNPQRQAESQGYRCVECGRFMYTDCAEEHEEMGGVCFDSDCLAGRMRKLVAIEKGARRLGELLTMDRQFSITPEQKLKQLEQCVYALGLAGIIAK